LGFESAHDFEGKVAWQYGLTRLEGIAAIQNGIPEDTF